MEKHSFATQKLEKIREKAFYCLYSLVLLIASCTEPAPQPSVEDFTGSWKVSAAKRNNRPALTLDGTYFNFSPNGTFESNLPIYEQQEAWQASFQLDKDTLIQGGSKSIKYLVKSWSDSLLVLEFTTRGIPFELQLIPAAPDSTTFE
jgi:hypothetical protein